MTVPSRQTNWQRREAGGPGLPDLVDLNQLSEGLSLTPEKITKLRKRGAFLPPLLRFQSKELWSWPHVSLWVRQQMMHKRGRSARYLRTQDVIPAVDLVSLSEIAARLDMPAGVLRSWSRSGQFPKPDYRWSDAEAWIWQNVEAWANVRDQQARTRLTANMTEARELVGHGPSTDRLRRLMEEVATDEATVLGDPTLPSGPDPTDDELLATFDVIEARLEELARQLERMDQATE